MHTYSNLYNQKTDYAKSYVEDLKLSYTAAGNVKQYNHFGELFGRFLKS